MIKYRYKAATAGGETFSGTFIAGSRDEVIKMIRANKGYPILVEEDDVFSDSRGKGLLGGVSTRDLALFCRQIHAMIYAGVPIIQCLNIMRQQPQKKTLKNATDVIYEDVQKGQLLSEALKKHSKIFPELLVSMVEAGEMSGTLDAALGRLMAHYDRESKLRAKITNATVYPIILSVVCFAVVTGLMVFVMPTFITMFEESGVVLPLLTRIMVAFSKSISSFWYLYLLGIAALGYSFTRYISTTEGRKKFDLFKLNFLPTKDLTRGIIAARFTRILSTMISSGIPLIQGLENIERTIGNRVVSEGIRQIREEVQRGSDLAGPVSRQFFFPVMVSNMIHVGEQSGTLDDILVKTAEYYDEDVENGFQRLVAMFEPAMIVIMGVMVAFIVISMALPMFDMVKTVQN